MFRPSTILRELVQSLAKVTLLLKYSVKLRRCILCGDMAACCHISTQYIINNNYNYNYTEDVIVMFILHSLYDRKIY